MTDRVQKPPFDIPASTAAPLLQLVAQSALGSQAEAQTFAPHTSTVDGKQVWSLWFGGTTAQGARFDIQFEFLSKVDREQIELMKRILIDVCIHAADAIEKGTL